MNVIYPKLRLSWLPAMFGYGLLGAVVAGTYGIIHDQITYSISHEYFTRLKFAQFHYADFGLPRRVFVGEIGFLATWWVGFFAGWFLARITVPELPRNTAHQYTLCGLVIMLVATMMASVIGCGLGLLHGHDFSDWRELAAALGVVDLPHFVRVAYIHNASYLGGLIGLIIAIVHIRGLKRSTLNSR